MVDEKCVRHFAAEEYSLADLLEAKRERYDMEDTVGENPLEAERSNGVYLLSARPVNEPGWIVESKTHAISVDMIRFGGHYFGADDRVEFECQDYVVVDESGTTVLEVIPTDTEIAVPGAQKALDRLPKALSAFQAGAMASGERHLQHAHAALGGNKPDLYGEGDGA